MNKILCRKGDACSFFVSVSGGMPLDTRYDKARFQVREAWDSARPLLLAVDDTTGITIDHANARVQVVIGAQATQSLGVTAPRIVAAQLRLYNSADADDCLSWPIEFVLMPAVISNG